MEPSDGLMAGLPIEAREILSFLPRAVIVISPDDKVVFWNSEAEQLYGWTSEEMLGTNARDVLVGADNLEAAFEVREQLLSRGLWQGDFPLVRRDGESIVVRITNRPVTDDTGNVVAIIGISEDVTAQRESEARAAAAADQERISRERLEFLRRITDVLANARDRHEVMADVTRAAVPMLGDWCSISVVVPGTDRPEVVTAHIDPAMVAYAEELQQRLPYDPHAPTGVPAVIRTGALEFYPDITGEIIDSIDPSDEARGILDELALRSAITVPLIKRGRILGAMSFVGTDANRRFTHDDVILAQAVAGRIASTLDNLRLIDQQRTIAGTLQASLLPSTLPAVAGLDIAVRYWAAGEGTTVGGDFYDVFGIDDGQWALTVGDVCGNGPEAAALTGLTRHTLRDAAWHGDSPVQALASLNKAMIEAATGSFCTALFARLKPAESHVCFELAIGGHPHPIVVHPNGEATTVGSTGTLIGVYTDARFTPEAFTLDPGDFLVLYTDGITDVPPPDTLHTDELVEIVRRAVRGCTSAEEGIEAVSSEILTRLPSADRGDDIALLVARVNDPEA